MKDISSVSFKRIEDSKEDARYSWHHLYFVSKKRYKVFGKEKTIQVCMEAFKEVERDFGYKIRELSFSKEEDHIHMIVDIPSKFSVQQTIQIFKCHSSSKIFKEIPNFRLRYPKGSFWSRWKYNGTVGPMNEKVVVEYIRRQDKFQSRIADFQ